MWCFGCSWVLISGPWLFTCGERENCKHLAHCIPSTPLTGLKMWVRGWKSTCILRGRRLRGASGTGVGHLPWRDLIALTAVPPVPPAQLLEEAAL